MAGDRGLRRLLPDRGTGRPAGRADRRQPVHRARHAAAAGARLSARAGGIDVMTHIYAEVLGAPLAHSKSPLIHGFWLAALGIDGDYRATHVTPEGLGDYFAARRAAPAWRGCNITIPHKQAALDHVEDRGGVRGTIGAINLALVAEDRALIGTNTDAGGFYAPIAALDLAGAPVVVIGAGGAARAVLFALSRVGVGPVTVLNRNVLEAARDRERDTVDGLDMRIGQAALAFELLFGAAPPRERDDELRALLGG